MARVVADPVWWFYLFWLPKYLVERRGFTMAEMGLVAWLPYLTADLGSLAGGWASGRLIRNRVTIVTSRKLVMLGAALVMPLGLLIPTVESSAIALGTICLITCAHMAWKTNLMTMTNDLFPTSIVGSVAGLVGLGSGLGGTIFTRITGYVVQNHPYKLIFFVLAFLHPAAWLIVHALIRRSVSEDRAAATPDAVPDPTA